MTRDEMLLRTGFYAGMASKLMGDDSYARRFLGKAETITEEAYLLMVSEINERLVAREGKLAADEDLWEKEVASWREGGVS